MIGRTLRQYRVIARLGEGGMGVVWKARDTSLDRDVALKVLPAAATGDPARKERFIREAKAASALNHPNIVTIYEINADDGVDFIAMECVDGETLADRLARGPLSNDAVIRIAQQVADGVGRAHAAGIIHRDLKPGNIMITADGLVKVLDFGLAKFDAARQQDEGTDMVTRMAVTRMGTAMGTLGYMSPEQAIGDTVDARSDVFSFGIILHQMLTNELPFAAETQAAILHKLHFSEPPSIESTRPDVPPFLAAIAKRALAKDPEDRFFTLSAVATALRAREPIATPAPATVPSATVPPAIVTQPPAMTAVRTPRSRARWAAVLVPTAALIVWALSVGRPEQPPGGQEAAGAPVSLTPFELSQQAATLLARDDLAGNVDRAIERLQTALAQDSGSALAHALLADAYRRKQRDTPDPQWLRQAQEAARRAVELNPDLAAARAALGWVRLAEGGREQALAEFERAAELDPLSAIPHLGRAMAHVALNQDPAAEAAFGRAIELAPDDWRPRFDLGDFFYRRARYAEAAAAWEVAARLTPDNVLAFRNLGATYFQIGRADEAASALQRALAIQPTAATYTNLGTIRFFQGRYADAVPAFEKSVELAATRYLNWANLADGYRWAPGRRADAAAAYRRASELVSEQIVQRPADPELRTRHAMYLAKMGSHETAQQQLAQIPAGSSLTPPMRYRMAVVHELAGRRAQAIDTLEQALKAGYPADQVKNEPEFTALRTDVRYQRLIGRF